MVTRKNECADLLGDIVGKHGLHSRLTKLIKLFSRVNCVTRLRRAAMLLLHLPRNLSGIDGGENIG